MQIYVGEPPAWPPLGALFIHSSLNGAELLKLCFFFAFTCKIHKQLQQWKCWNALKTKGNISKHDRANHKHPMGLRCYLRAQDRMCHWISSFHFALSECWLLGYCNFAFASRGAHQTLLHHSLWLIPVIIQHSTTGKYKAFCIHSASPTSQ